MFDVRVSYKCLTLVIIIIIIIISDLLEGQTLEDGRERQFEALTERQSAVKQSSLDQ